MLGLLLVQRRDQVWIAYVVMALSVSAQAFFEPARTATIPNITSADELMPANALVQRDLVGDAGDRRIDRRTGHALAGRNVAFVINAASFFVSAVFHQPDAVRLDAAAVRRASPGWSALTGIPDLLEGFRYIRQRSHVAALMFVKAGWGLAGGVLLLLTIFGQRVFPVGGSTSAGGIGVLYGARGHRRGLGPIALRWILGQKPATLRRTIGPAYFVVGVFYVALAARADAADRRARACSARISAARFSGCSARCCSRWRCRIGFRGRVFAAELALVTFTSSSRATWTGYGLDRQDGRRARWRSGWESLFCVPGRAAGCSMLSRWPASTDKALEGTSYRCRPAKRKSWRAGSANHRLSSSSRRFARDLSSGNDASYLLRRL